MKYSSASSEDFNLTELQSFNTVVSPTIISIKRSTSTNECSTTNNKNSSSKDKYKPINKKKYLLNKIRFLYYENNIKGLSKLFDPEYYKDGKTSILLNDVIECGISLNLLFSLFYVLNLKKQPSVYEEFSEYKGGLSKSEKSSLSILRLFFLDTEKSTIADDLSSSMLRLLLNNLQKKQLIVISEKYGTINSCKDEELSKAYPYIKYLSHLLSKESSKGSRYSSLYEDQRRIENAIVNIFEEELNKQYFIENYYSNSVGDDDFVTRQRSRKDLDLLSYQRKSPDRKTRQQSENSFSSHYLSHHDESESSVESDDQTSFFSWGQHTRNNSDNFSSIQKIDSREPDVWHLTQDTEEYLEREDTNNNLWNCGADFYDIYPWDEFSSSACRVLEETEREKKKKHNKSPSNRFLKGNETSRHKGRSLKLNYDLLVQDYTDTKPQTNDAKNVIKIENYSPTSASEETNRRRATSLESIDQNSILTAGKENENKNRFESTKKSLPLPLLAACALSPLALCHVDENETCNSLCQVDNDEPCNTMALCQVDDDVQKFGFEIHHSNKNKTYRMPKSCLSNFTCDSVIPSCSSTKNAVDREKVYHRYVTPTKLENFFSDSPLSSMSSYDNGYIEKESIEMTSKINLENCSLSKNGKACNESNSKIRSLLKKIKTPSTKILISKTKTKLKKFCKEASFSSKITKKNKKSKESMERITGGAFIQDEENEKERSNKVDQKLHSDTNSILLTEAKNHSTSSSIRKIGKIFSKSSKDISISDGSNKRKKLQKKILILSNISKGMKQMERIRSSFRNKQKILKEGEGEREEETTTKLSYNRETNNSNKPIMKKDSSINQDEQKTSKQERVKTFKRIDSLRNIEIACENPITNTPSVIDSILSGDEESKRRYSKTNHLKKRREKDEKLNSKSNGIQEISFRHPDILTSKSTWQSSKLNSLLSFEDEISDNQEEKQSFCTSSTGKKSENESHLTRSSKGLFERTRSRISSVRRKDSSSLLLSRKKRKTQGTVTTDEVSALGSTISSVGEQQSKSVGEYSREDSFRNIHSIIDMTLSEEEDEQDEVVQLRNQDLSWTHGADVVVKCIHAATKLIAEKLTSFFEDRAKDYNKLLHLEMKKKEQNASMLEDEINNDLGIEVIFNQENKIFINEDSSSSANSSSKESQEIEDSLLVYMEIIREKDKDEIEVILNTVGEEKPIIEEMSALVSHAEKLVICAGGAKNVAEDVRKNSEAFTFGFRDSVSTSVLDLMDACSETKFMHTIIPDDQSREFLDATCQVFLAGLGGAAVITEAIQKSVNRAFETHRLKAANTIRSRFGIYAGKVVDDGGKAIQDALNTIYIVSRLGDGVVFNFLAKAVGRKDMKKKEV